MTPKYCKEERQHSGPDHEKSGQMGKYPGLIPSVLTIFSLNEGKISDNNYQFIKFSMVKSISQMRLKEKLRRLKMILGPIPKEHF